MQKNIQNHAKEIAKLISNVIDVEQIFLFGSYAYGTPKENSDLDFYVVADLKGKRKTELLFEARKNLIGKTSFPVDILLSDKSDFEYRKNNNSTLEYIVSNEGVKLYG